MTASTRRSVKSATVPASQARELLPPSEAARRLAVSERTVRVWASQGLLPAFRVGPRLLRFDAADVEAMVRRLPTAGPGAA